MSENADVPEHLIKNKPQPKYIQLIQRETV